MAQRYDVNVIYQTEDESKLHIHKNQYYYEDITKSELLILEQMTNTPQSAEQIKTTKNGDLDICRSNLYKLLDLMADREIISRGTVNLPPDYKKKHPFGYFMTNEQKAELKVCLIRKNKRNEKILMNRIKRNKK